MQKQLTSLILLLLLSTGAGAQESWRRYSWGTLGREGFTILLPAVPEQVAKETGEQGIAVSTDVAKFEITFLDQVNQAQFNKRVKEAMNIVGGGAGSGLSQTEVEAELTRNRATKDISICGHSGIEFGNSSSIQQFVLVNNRLYHIFISGANRSNPSVEKTLGSFSLINPWRPWKGLRTNQVSGLPESDISFAPELCKNVEVLNSVRDAPQLPRNSALQITSQPNAIYPEAAKKNGVQGTVSLRVTFLADRTIGNITVIKGMDSTFNASAIKAAKQIQFEPQRQNGKPVNTVKVIQYSFAIY